VFSSLLHPQSHFSETPLHMCWTTVYLCLLSSHQSQTRQTIWAMTRMFSHQVIKLLFICNWARWSLKNNWQKSLQICSVISVTALSKMCIFFCLPCTLFVTDSVFDSKILDLKDSSSFEGQTLMMLPPTWLIYTLRLKINAFI